MGNKTSKSSSLPSLPFPPNGSDDWTLYIIPGNGFCIKAEQFLDSRGVQVLYNNVENYNDG